MLFRYGISCFALLALCGCGGGSTNHLANPAENRALFDEARVKYDFDLVMDPVSGKIPEGIFEAERSFAMAAPLRQPESGARTAGLNTYLASGPNNTGGRTRALAYDMRYNGASNRVIIAGSVSGGIMRSEDGGLTWQTVAPNIDIHSLSALAQDPRPGFQDHWYAGGGEAYGGSAGLLGDIYLGHGLYKSTDNGLSWTRLPLGNVTGLDGSLLAGGSAEALDHPFDYVSTIEVDPVNGHVYVAGHNAILRSVNGGGDFEVVLGGTAAFGAPGTTTARQGQTEVALSSNHILAAINGGNPDISSRGVWISPTGNKGSWSRIAGGTNPGVDAVPGWRGNADATSEFKRIIMTVAPSNRNIVYVAYQNGLRHFAPEFKPEADLYRLDITGSGPMWTNRSANMPDFPNGNSYGADPFGLQLGYDFFIKVKPDNPNFLLLGGISLYRSTDGFATTANTMTIGGFSVFPGPPYNVTGYAFCHVDMHNFAFNPANPQEGIVANDGGLQRTASITQSQPSWTIIRNYQTLQYYHVGIDPGAGRNNFIGGTQDNGVSFRDANAVFSFTTDSNAHRQLMGADGAAAAIGARNGNVQYVYASTQVGTINRFQAPSTSGVLIRPNGLTTNPAGGFGEFVTNFRLDPDNTEDLYFVNYNRLFRTTSASTVTPSSGWTELTGVAEAVAPFNPITNRDISIRAMALTRGPYTTAHVLYFGTTSGRIFRLEDPRNAVPGQAPIDITPQGLSGTVQDISVNPNNDDEVMAVVSNYNTVSIWWTNNGRSTNPNWRNAEGNLSLPSVRSCAIVVKKDAANNPVTEYYAGTSVGLFSTANLQAVIESGASPVWQREGGAILNFPVVQSIAYRPVDNVLLVGTHGNGLYHTYLGTPNFIPNQTTGISPVLNDRNFIASVFPTITSENVYYQTGNIPGIRHIIVQVFTLSGQKLMEKQAAYANGSLSVRAFPRNTLILVITSSGNRYRHVQKVVRR